MMTKHFDLHGWLIKRKISKIKHNIFETFIFGFTWYIFMDLWGNSKKKISAREKRIKIHLYFIFLNSNPLSTATHTTPLSSIHISFLLNGITISLHIQWNIFYESISTLQRVERGEEKWQEFIEIFILLLSSSWKWKNNANIFFFKLFIPIIWGVFDDFVT